MSLGDDTNALLWPGFELANDKANGITLNQSRPLQLHYKDGALEINIYNNQR